MFKKILLTSIMAIVAVTNVASADGDKKVTSKNYVDTAVATRQEKITAGTTGNVVTYNGTTNGQAQFSERGIWDWEYGEQESFPSEAYESIEVVEGHEGDLINAQIFTESLNDIFENFDSQVGDAGTVVVRDQFGKPFSSRNIYDGANDYNSSTDANKLITAGAVDEMISAELPTGTADTVVMYDSNGDIGGERAINTIPFFGSDGGAFADNDPDALVTVSNLSGSIVQSLSSNGDYTGSRNIPTAVAVVGFAQPKKVCAGWPDGVEHTYANCWLWEFPY